MDKNYIPLAAALKKLKTARIIPQTVYLYGATGYGKTELVRQYLCGRKYTYLSCEELPWKLSTLPPEEPGRQSRRVVDEFTLELAEMISGNLHVTALLEQAAEQGLVEG